MLKQFFFTYCSWSQLCVRKWVDWVSSQTRKKKQTSVPVNLYIRVKNQHNWVWKQRTKLWENFVFITPNLLLPTSVLCDLWWQHQCSFHSLPQDFNHLAHTIQNLFLMSSLNISFLSLRSLILVLHLLRLWIISSIQFPLLYWRHETENQKRQKKKGGKRSP